MSVSIHRIAVIVIVCISIVLRVRVQRGRSRWTVRQVRRPFVLRARSRARLIRATAMRWRHFAMRQRIDGQSRGGVQSGERGGQWPKTDAAGC